MDERQPIIREGRGEADGVARASKCGLNVVYFQQAGPGAVILL